LAVLEEMERQREESVTKKEFNELKEIVRELIQAHREGEKRITKLEETVQELIQAQRETREELKELAQAHRSAEKRITKLEETVQELIQAQKKTEEELKKLTAEHRKTREQLGGLQHTIGYLLEDRAYKGLPNLLERDFGLRLLSPLKRRYLELSPGRYIEINILGEAIRDGEEVFVVGECKSQLRKRDVDAFLKGLSRIQKALGKEVVPILVTYQTPPQVEEYVREKGIKLYFSYELPL